MKNLNLVRTLCFGGLIPFYSLSILTFFQKSIFIIDLFSIYSLVILCFLCGSTWLQLVLYDESEKIHFLKIFVVLLPIFLILIEILLKINLKIFVFGLGYLVIYLIDQKFLKNLEYLSIRKALTILVLISHIIILIGIYTNGI